MVAASFDQADMRILRVLQEDAGLSQRAVAEKVGLSQNACWRRMKALEESGVIKGRTLRLDRAMLGVDLVAFVLVRTRSHSSAWLDRFRQRVRSIPEITDFFRISGDYDYLLKVISADMRQFDSVYQRLIDKMELDSVTSYFAMETIEEHRPLALTT